MTTAELIELLKDYPQDALVVVDGYEGGICEVETISTTSIVKDVNPEDYYGDHEEVCAPGDYNGTERFTAVYIPRN